MQAPIPFHDGDEVTIALIGWHLPVDGVVLGDAVWIVRFHCLMYPVSITASGEPNFPIGAVMLFREHDVRAR